MRTFALVIATLFSLAQAETEYVFVRLTANGATVTGNTDITNIGGEELPRAEWIQCKRVTYGVKRDIGTGARVSGHTHYDRIEFDTTQGPATPMLMQALERGHTVNLEMRFYHNRRDGQEEKYMQINADAGRLGGVSMADGRMIISYAYHSMSIDHLGEDGATAAHFSWEA